MVAIKKKQHYVPRGYLKYWLTSRECKPGEKSQGVWVYNVNGARENRFSTNLMDISQQRYFYKLVVDIDVCNLLRCKYQDSDPVIIQLVELFEFLLQVNEVEKSSEECAGVTDIAGKLYLEKLYEKIEGKFQKTIDAINESIQIYTSNLTSGKANLLDLIGIFVVQLFRTKKMRRDCSNEIKGLTSHRANEKIDFNTSQEDSFLKVVLFVDAMAFAYDLAGKEFSVELLENLEGESFLTSNSPAFRISIPEEKNSIEKFVGFMPLSPRIAMIIRGYKPIEKNFLVRRISNQEVSHWNKLIAQEADDEIYSVTEAANL